METAERYRRFGQVEAAAVSPLYRVVAISLAESDEAMRAIANSAARRRKPELILAALHDLALSGRAPTLAAAYTANDSDRAGPAAVDTVVQMTDALAAIVDRRQLRAEEVGKHTVLYPALAEAAHRADAPAIGLIDLGCSAGFNLHVDRVGVTYGDGLLLGDSTSPVQQKASIRGTQAPPSRSVPEVTIRIGIDPHPIDVAATDDARWLRACVPPDQSEQAAALEAEIAVATANPPLLLSGDPVHLLSDAVARVPIDSLPVVTTTWALSRLSVDRRREFMTKLEAAATVRHVAWVSVEGVGVAPTVPTLGDRRASGHSVIGVSVLDQDGPRSEAVGRCWSRGRFVSWLGHGR